MIDLFQVSGLSHVSTNPLEILASGDIVDTDVDDDDYYNVDDSRFPSFSPDPPELLQF